MHGSDDEHYNLVQKALYVEPLTRPINSNFIPEDGSEFIHKSRLEDAFLKFSLNDDQDEVKKSKQSNSKSLRPWGRKQAKEFCQYASKLNSNRKLLLMRFPKTVETPEEEKEWCIYCLGSDLYSKIYGNDKRPKDEVQGQPPFLSIVLHLTQNDVRSLVEYHHQWFKIIGMEDAIALWVYVLLACLKKPIDDECEKFLETFYDDCKIKLKECEDEEVKKRVHLISAILEDYFCVKSYKVSGLSLLDCAFHKMLSKDYIKKETKKLRNI